MFQSETDDLNFDEEFLNDIFEVPQLSNDQNKRISDEHNEQPTKKVCLNTNQDATTKKLLSIIKPPIFATHLPPKIEREHLDKNRKVVQRKFPGPAGILPEQKQIPIKIEEIDTSATKKLEPDVILCSQLSENNFKKGPWQHMLLDWSNNKEKINLPDKYTITWTKCKATAKKLIGQKTPFLAAVIQSIDTTNRDPMIVLRDKTDEIQATLLYEVWDEYYEFLIPGSVIVLKQVGVLSTLKKQYLAITSNNLITIYSEHETEETGNIENRITKVQELTISHVIKIIDEVKRSNETQKKIEQPVVNNPYFKTNKNENTTIVNNSVNKTLQIISNVRSANNMFQTVTPSKQNNTTLQTPNKFKFKAKIDHNLISKEPNKENNKTNSINNFATTSKSTSTVLNETEDILTQVFDGVDTASIFEDF